VWGQGRGQMRRSHFQARGVVCVEFQDARTTAARTRCRTPRRCRLSGHGASRAGGTRPARAARSLGQRTTGSLSLTSLRERIEQGIPSGRRRPCEQTPTWQVGSMLFVRHVLRTISPCASEQVYPGGNPPRAHPFTLSAAHLTLKMGR
jgi:hypothetical protein